MNRFVVGSLLLVTALLLSCAKSSPAHPPGVATREAAPRQAPYVYCNVYLQDACFGIAAGDQLQMEIPVDFTIYRLTLGGGVQVEIYYGTNPPLEKTVGGEASWSSEIGDLRTFEVVKEKDVIESSYVYKPVASKFGNVLYVKVLHSARNNGLAKSFIENFRPCSASNGSLQCADSKLFERRDE